MWGQVDVSSKCVETFTACSNSAVIRKLKVFLLIFQLKNDSNYYHFSSLSPVWGLVRTFSLKLVCLPHWWSFCSLNLKWKSELKIDFILIYYDLTVSLLQCIDYFFYSPLHTRQSSGGHSSRNILDVTFSHHGNRQAVSFPLVTLRLSCPLHAAAAAFSSGWIKRFWREAGPLK